MRTFLLAFTFFLTVRCNIFHLYDLDKDGSLDLNELRHSGCRMKEAGQTACVASVLEEQTSAIFLALDTDRSGTISKSEFPRFQNPIDPAPQQVHLAVTTDPTQMLVMWVTRHEDESVLQYGLQSGVLQWVAKGTRHTYNAGIDGWYGWIHQVLLTGLKTDTRYYYAVGPQTNPSGEFTFVSSPAQSDSTYYTNTFAVVADMGTVIPSGWAVTDQIASDHLVTPFSLVVHAGDVCYAGTGHEWELEEIWDVYGNQIQKVASTVPWMIAVGNHERFYNFTAFTSRYTMPSSQSEGVSNFWFSYDYGNVHFTHFSTEHDYTPNSPQYAWLEQDLAKANKNNNTQWLIMVGHRPMYSSDSDEWDSHRPGAPFQKQIEPLMLKHKVDLYLCGHMHMYERTYPVINGVTQQKGPIFQNPPATIHVNQATGVFLDNDFIMPQPDWSASRTNKWGYGNMKVNMTHLQYTFVRLWEDEIGDQFWIYKS